MFPLSKNRTYCPVDYDQGEEVDMHGDVYKQPISKKARRGLRLDNIDKPLTQK